MEKIVTIYTCENHDNILYIMQLLLFKKTTLRTHITNHTLLVIHCYILQCFLCLLLENYIWKNF